MSKKHYYDICPICGATLDPGEHCDCTMEVAGEKYHVAGCVKDHTGNMVPLLDIPMVSDNDWMKRSETRENQQNLIKYGYKEKVAAV